MQTADLGPVASEHHSALAEINSDGPHNWSAHQTESNSRSEKGIQFKVDECSDRTFNEDISERCQNTNCSMYCELCPQKFLSCTRTNQSTQHYTICKLQALLAKN